MIHDCGVFGSTLLVQYIVNSIREETVVSTSNSACLWTSSARCLFRMNSASLATRTMWSFMAWHSNLWWCRENKCTRIHFYVYDTCTSLSKKKSNLINWSWGGRQISLNSDTRLVERADVKTALHYAARLQVTAKSLHGIKERTECR